VAAAVDAEPVAVVVDVAALQLPMLLAHVW
jgi:hypothetical protein